MRGARLPVGIGLEGLPQTGPVCGIALPAGLRESDRLPAPIFTPATKAQSGHDMNISEAKRGDARRAGGARRVLRDLTLRALRATARRTPSRAASSSPTRSSNSACCTGQPARERPHPDRRGADARLVALLAAGRLPPGGPQPSFDKQFVRDYLERDPLEQAAARAVAARRRRAADAREVRRSLPPADRPGAPVSWPTPCCDAARAPRRGMVEGRDHTSTTPSRVREALHRPRARRQPTAASTRPPERLGIHRNTLSPQDGRVQRHNRQSLTVKT